MDFSPENFPSQSREELLDNVSVFPVPPLDYFAKFFSAGTGEQESSVEDADGSNNARAAVDTDEPMTLHQRPPRFPSPPPIPADLCVNLFGTMLTPDDHVIRELEEQGIDRLGTDQANRKRLLKNLIWSSIAKFFEILECLIKNPQSEQRLQLTTDLQTIFINFHHTVNQYRVTQAHESLFELLKEQTCRNLQQSDCLLQGMTSALDSLDGQQEVMVIDEDNGVSGDIDVVEYRKDVARLEKEVFDVRMKSEHFSSRNIPTHTATDGGS